MNHHPDLTLKCMVVSTVVRFVFCFEAPSGRNNYEVHGQYSCPICLEDHPE
jgi:hypothetical protein